MTENEKYYIFRLQKDDCGLAENLEHWSQSYQYDDQQINAIQSTNPDSTTEPTSIPSPFARLDLNKTAFLQVATEWEQAPVKYRKIVSDSIDVAEIFFNAEKLKDKIEIIVWDKETDLAQLLKTHPTLGKTLEVYLQQDAASYHFDKLKRIYLLNYIGPERPNEINIIGATSPVTLFFGAANEWGKKDDLSFVTRHIQFGQDKPFDDKLQPLYKRDFEFVKYLFAFRKNYPNFANDFFEFNKYLDRNFSELSYEQQQQIDCINHETLEEYAPLHVNSDGTNFVEILGFPLHRKVIAETFESDFEIQSSIYKDKKPLVLPHQKGNEYTQHRYTYDKWSREDMAPITDNKPLNKRTLPVSNDVYPYITVSDFLEDTIYRFPYDINSDYFFYGNLNKVGEGVSYALPIKKDFFHFFSPTDLISELQNGKKMFELRNVVGGVTVFLRIPIKKGYILFKRTYYEKNEPVVDAINNQGAVIAAKFGLGIIPPIRLDRNPNYRIAFFDKTQNGAKATFYENNKQIAPKTHVVRREREIGLCSSETYVVEDYFNIISVESRHHSNIIIPIFKQPKGTDQFTFAIDFGTTNSHIEYSVNQSPSIPFNITPHEKQIQKLHLDYKQDVDIHIEFENSFIPETIGYDGFYKFPMRTAFAEQKEINYNLPVYTLANGNIPFRYEKAKTPLHNDIKTDIKWSVNERERVKLYLENICMLLRNKVLLNNGDLSATKLIWFYPVSMTESQYNKLKAVWKELYTDYFGNNTENLICMTESIAPYYYYRNTQGAKSNVVTIDIGGETTDVFVVEENTPKLLTSFRFASNAIFGDGYNWNSDNNGFVNTFKNEILQILELNRLDELKMVFENIESKKISTDIISFFFSLENNKQIKSANIPLNFIQKLSDNDRLKYVFILFYTAILYFVANTIKAKGIAMPYTLAFSGNGAKSLKVLSEDNNTLAKFSKIIFEKVYKKHYETTNDFEVIFDENPKEATGKGGIIHSANYTIEDTEKLQHTLLGIDTETFSDKHTTYKTIDNEMLRQVTKQVEKTIDFTLQIHEDNNEFFSKKFGISPSVVKEAQKISKKNIEEYLKMGLNKKNVELQQSMDSEIEEPLFFYGLVGVLNNLARELTK